MSSSWPFWGFPIWQAAMSPPPLKDDRTHFCSCLCSSTAASPRYRWSRGNDYSSTGLGRDRNVTSLPISSHQLPHLLLLGPPLTAQEMVPNTLTCLRCTLGPAYPPVHTQLLVAAKWHGRRCFSWYMREPLLPQKCQEAFRCWWCGHNTCPLVLLVSYFFAIRIPILLPPSSLPAVFQAETKACSQSYKEPTVILLALNNCLICHFEQCMDNHPVLADTYFAFLR